MERDGQPTPEVPPQEPGSTAAPSPGEASPLSGTPFPPAVPTPPPPEPIGARESLSSRDPFADLFAPPVAAETATPPASDSSPFRTISQFAPPPPAPPISPRAFSTTGVPHYAPPGLPPPFAFEPGVGSVAAPPAVRRSILRPIARGVRELAETVILALLIFLLVRAVVQNFQVEGRSMEPTFDSGWYLLVNKAIYWEINLDTVHKFVPFIDPGEDPTRYIFRGPQRGDVIVFHPPGENGEASERDFIKRVIGLPGETVEVRDCTVFINGKPLEEPYLDQPMSGMYGPEVVPAGEYFVMGDNRNNSSDSRSFGPVPADNIIGIGWLTYWPFDVFGLVDNDAKAPGDVSADDQQPKLTPACPPGS